MSDFETTTFAQQNVGVRNAYVFQQYFGVAVRRIVITKDRQRADDFDAGGVHRHQNHRVLLVTRRVGVGQAHEDHDFAARVASTGSPPLAAVDHPLITFTAGVGLHVGSIRGSNARLGHTEAGANLASQQRLEPFFFVLVVAVANDGFHVAGVRRAAVERLGRQAGAAHQLGQRSVFQVGQASTQVGFGQKQVPQAGSAGLDLELFDDGGGLPAIPFGYLLMKGGFSRENMFLHERVNALA